MKISKLINRLFCDLTLGFVGILIATPMAISHGDLAAAEGFAVDEYTGQTFPYTTTFTISAYYSPLPCQSFYTTGSYEGDIRLNGGGVRGADGTPVYPGMIAAPKSYPFGTKMYIPGVGVVAVHDRGGAIVAANGDPNRHDRLDIWMGYGDIGLKRALNWGKRNVEVTVYGQNEGISEQIALEGYDPAEATTCSGAPAPQNPAPTDPAPITPAKPPVTQTVAYSDKFEADLKPGDQNADVIKLQKELKNLNFYKADITGVYDELTKHAVYKFQQSQGLVGDEVSAGAGTLGPKTRHVFNQIIDSRKYTKTIIVRSGSASQNLGDRILTIELDPGVTHPDVRKLQLFLKEQGFYAGALFTDYFGGLTQEALIKFQIAYKIISSEKDRGAGRVGPTTLNIINSFM